MKEKYERLLEKLLVLLPDFITGSTSAMKAKAQKKYSGKALDVVLQEKKKKTLALYIAVCLIFLAAILITGTGRICDDPAISTINRPSYGEAVKPVNVKAELLYKGSRIEREVTLRARQRDPTGKEKLEILKEMADRLPGVIAGKNKDLMNLTDDLNLIDRDSGTGILINWTSSNPAVIGDEGIIDFIKAKPGEELVIRALLRLEDYETNWESTVRISTHLPEKQYRESLIRRLEETVAALNKSTNFDELFLPAELDDGVQIRWKTAEPFPVSLLFLLFLLSLAIVYMLRYRQIDKELKEAEESIYRDLPDFTYKLVLLLNAGLVINTALLKIAEDYEKQYRGSSTMKPEKERRYFYEELSEIKKRVSETKAPILYELNEFAQRTGVRELIRMVAIISDNVNKGNTLAEKLETEGEQLWGNRKKLAEEKGRVAETKLTFPLTLLLIILIMITISPAMMEM